MLLKIREITQILSYFNPLINHDRGFTVMSSSDEIPKRLLKPFLPTFRQLTFCVAFVVEVVSRYCCGYQSPKRVKKKKTHIRPFFSLYRKHFLYLYTIRTLNHKKMRWLNLSLLYFWIIVYARLSTETVCFGCSIIATFCIKLKCDDQSK